MASKSSCKSAAASMAMEICRKNTGNISRKRSRELQDRANFLL